eukprot:TRINITY_DN7960_c0_g1_i2.p1 TRINITY_DN7960_c0_g1~~TRINITY_DN7960_c0_g1_i2.p1  ORF type:complete len:462 (-),score=142.66 TRINITY_DN7960_c0_g1_i2:411-1796(-)
MDAEAVRKSKQQYLYNAIIEGGYDHEKFIAYIKDMKGKLHDIVDDGDDVDVWSMTELRSLVYSFIEAEEDKKQCSENVEEVKEVEEKEAFDLLDDIEVVDKSEFDGVEDPELLFEDVNLGEEYKKVISEENGRPIKIAISVGDPKIQEAKLFASASVLFTIETRPYGWKVLRKYKDVLLFRKLMREYYPGAIIPPLDKKLSKDKTDSKWIAGASGRLQKFFYEFQRDPLLRHSRLTYTFLTMNDRKSCARKSEGLLKSSCKSPLELARLRTSKEVSGAALQQANHWNKYSLVTKELYAQAKKDLVETDKATQTLSELMEKNAGNFKKLAIVHELIQATELADLFNKLKIIYNLMGTTYKQQADMCREKVTDFFDYYQEEIDSVVEVLDVLKSAREAYRNKKQEVMAQKEHLFAEGKVSAWQIPSSALKDMPISEFVTHKELVFPYLLPEVIAEMSIRKRAS